MLSEERELQVQRALVLAHRLNSSGSLEVLIRWQVLPAFEGMWESFATIQEHFPDFHLKGKVDARQNTGERRVIGHRSVSVRDRPAVDSCPSC